MSSLTKFCFVFLTLNDADFNKVSFIYVSTFSFVSYLCKLWIIINFFSDYFVNISLYTFFILINNFCSDNDIIPNTKIKTLLYWII